MPSAHPAPNDSRSLARSLRWGIVFAASVVLHAAMFNWVDGRLAFPSIGSEPEEAMHVVLRAPPPAPPVRPQVAARPTQRPRPKPAPAKPVVRPVIQPAPMPLVPGMSMAAATAPEETGAGMQEGVSADVDDTPPLAEVMPVLEPIESIQLPQPVLPPPSAELRYDVHALRNDQNWYGKGKFRWEADEDTYQLTGETRVSFLFPFTVLNFASKGAINELGVAPVLYSEKPWRKPIMKTHFQHTRQIISFSASSATYPYYGGEQDRASILWQLAGIGRGAPERFYPGAAIEVVVAGTRDAVPWHIQVVGQEDIDSALGTLSTWRVARSRKAGSRDERVDIWLAPEQHWYPVKVRYTYTNGDHLELTLSELTLLERTEHSERIEHSEHSARAESTEWEMHQ